MESNKIENDVPPAPESWKDLPGELVMRFEAGAGLPNAYGFEWQVKKLTAGKHYPEDDPRNERRRGIIFEASTPYRHCVYQGDTAEEAIGCMMKGMALLSREGAINPNNPHGIGSPIIQHAMEVLSERLLWNIEQRQNHLVMGGYADSPSNIWPSPYASARYTAGAVGGEGKDDSVSKQAREDAFNEQMVKTVARDNEVVSALATAIAALARVKDI